MSSASSCTRELDALLRQCVACGLCLPHCATYVATGNEVQSPRGRLALLQDMLDQPDVVPPESFLTAFDFCIGCRACETACPGGVPFDLLAYGQQQAEERELPPSSGSSPSHPPEWVLSRLDRPVFLGILRSMARAARATLSATAGSRWRKKLEGGLLATPARMLGTLPCGPGSDTQLESLMRKILGPEAARVPARLKDIPASPPGPSTQRVVFFRGCANQGLLPHSSRRLVELLQGNGCQIEMVAGQECCGALAAHTGRPGRAATLRRRNSNFLESHLEEEAVLLVEAAGCGLELREKYGAAIAQAAVDATVLLEELGLEDLAPLPLKVVYHDPCHLRHGQGIVAEPRQLLKRIPAVTLLEPIEPELCCGSGGAWGLHHPELSGEIGRRKARHLAATGADLVVTSNPGCLGQIADGLALEAPHLPIIPLTDLLWFAWRLGPS